MYKLLLIILTMSLAAFAQDKGDGEDGARRPPTQEFVFDGDLIEGDLSRPDGEFISPGSRSKHTSLIRIREDFNREVMDSVGDL